MERSEGDNERQWKILTLIAMARGSFRGLRGMI